MNPSEVELVRGGIIIGAGALAFTVTIAIIVFFGEYCRWRWLKRWAAIVGCSIAACFLIFLISLAVLRLVLTEADLSSPVSRNAASDTKLHQAAYPVESSTG